MKKLADICYTIVHGKIGSWNKHVNMFPIDLITKVVNNYVYLQFLVYPSSVHNFPGIHQKVQLFVINLKPTNV